ncbi:MAG: glycerate kinase [Actinomycetota bacterium]|nr:glycerate kinase [Actinomycetota bacterium]
MREFKVVIAPDKFKGSLTAVEAAKSIEAGVRDVVPEAQIVLCPMADGGDGTVEAVAQAIGAQIHSEDVQGPLPGQRVRAMWASFNSEMISGRERTERLLEEYGFSVDAGIALVEMAQASGLSLIRPVGLRDPMKTSTVGTGELVKRVMDEGFRQIIVGVGGSATVDGGAGLAAALGYRFLGSGEAKIEPCGGSLEEIVDIDVAGRDPRIEEAKFLVAVDVSNPLLGENGAARVFGPQKGATPEQVEILERGLESFYSLIEERLGVDATKLPGSGAAGGLAAGMVAFCGAKIVSGVEVISATVGLEEMMEGASLILTGEGNFDAQTTSGKAPAGVAEIAFRKRIPVIVLAGGIASEKKPNELTVPVTVVPGPVAEDYAMENARELLRQGTRRTMELLRLGCLVFGDMNPA